MNKYLRIGFLAVCLLALPLSWSASAQTGSDPNRTTTSTPVRVVDTRDDDTDWGWLGLLGLAGLAGLLGRRKEPVRHRANDPMNSR